MRKIGRFTIGGLQTKILNLCIILVISTIVVFAIVGIVQLRSVSKLAKTTAEEQNETIQEISQESMMEITKDSMLQTAKLATRNSNNVFWTMERDFSVLGEQVQDVFENPENYTETSVEAPKQENDGKYVLQVMYAEEEAKTDADTQYIIKRLANLEPMMREIVKGNSDYVMDCYIALPNGTTLAMDNTSGGKLDDEGELQEYDPRTRDWYTGAVKSKEMYFSSAIHSFFYDVSEVVFGLPIYEDGELVAVVEGSMKLDSLQELVSQVTIGQYGFSVLLSADGQLVYSPRTEGELAMDEQISTDIRGTVNENLNSVIKQAMAGRTSFAKTYLDDEAYYVAYAPIETTGWSQIMFVPKERLESSTTELIDEVNQVSDDAVKDYAGVLGKSLILTVIVLVLLILNAVIVSILFSSKLLKPINVMTTKVKEIRGGNLFFKKEKIYETGDEIEVLADAFEDLSERSKSYVKELMAVTAEKERIGTELSVATGIQAGMLPSTFPMYPERTQFDVYASMTPAKEVGGDFYDIFMVDDDHLALVMADVSGKGIPAALFMVVSKTLIKNRTMMGGTPAEILADVNNQLIEGNESDMFVTVWLGILTISTGHMIEANAGHENPVIRHENGEVELLERKHGFVLGGMEGMRYKDDEFDLAPGDAIFVYTDGVPEATDANEQLFGSERMMSAIKNAPDGTPEKLLESVRADVEEFVGEAPQFDDLTMLAMKFTG
ncbi:MAG: SpoIIE family protein phosphatase [Eubacterium sp.]|nr:SpoIIE family protein phosphatase [Eubacterium sp.]